MILHDLVQADGEDAPFARHSSGDNEEEEQLRMRRVFVGNIAPEVRTGIMLLVCAEPAL
jgi:hypothetical protein